MPHVSLGAGREALNAEALLTPASEARPGQDWCRGAMFYEIYIRSFADSNGDGVGDLRGVLGRMDYLSSLGVDGIWLSPFYPSPGKDFGYDITDFKNVDPQMGTLDDVLEIIEACHDQDLKILLDFIPCHTSTEHPWFAESRRSREGPRADWYVWADAAPDGGPPNNWLSSFGGGAAWTWEPRRQQYYYHPFLSCQPALDLRNPAVMEAILSALRFWLDMGVDGFRLDAVQCLAHDPHLRSNPPRHSGDDEIRLGGGPGNPFARQQHLFDRDHPDAIPMIETFRATVDEYDPPRVLIGELADVDSSRCAVKYTLDGKRLNAVYDFDLINSDQTFEKWMDLLDIRSTFMKSGWLMHCLTNHDSVRAVSNLTSYAVEAGRIEEAAKLLLFLQATLRGGGIVFQGDELGLPQPDVPFGALRDPWSINLWPDFVGRDGVRSPFPWNAAEENCGFSPAVPWMPVAPEHESFGVATQEGNPDSVLSFFRALMRWRRATPVLRTGRERAGSTDNGPLVSFERHDDAERLTVLLNFSLQERLYNDAEGLHRLADVPGAKARVTGHGVRLPGLGFGVLEHDDT